jgi:hypothetical protein
MKSAALLLSAVVGVFGGPLSVSDTLLHGQATFKITTPSARYYYQKQSAAFAWVIDKDGNDWVGYRPGGEDAGEYRGIPNLGNNFGHPGLSGSAASTSTLVQDDDKVTITSTRNDGAWKCTWDIYATHATMTLLKAGGNFWVLYEGTPFGAFEPARQYSVRSDGTRRALSENWSEQMPSPQWIYFGENNRKRVLFYALHKGDALFDMYFPMGAMTVFGFSREFECCGQYFTKNDIPLTMSFGLIEDDSYDAIKPIVNAIINDETAVVDRAKPLAPKYPAAALATGTSFTLTGRHATAQHRGVSLIRQSDGRFIKQVSLSSGSGHSHRGQ